MSRRAAALAARAVSSIAVVLLRARGGGGGAAGLPARGDDPSPPSPPSSDSTIAIRDHVCSSPCTLGVGLPSERGFGIELDGRRPLLTLVTMLGPSSAGSSA